MGEKIFANHVHKKGLIFKINKELQLKNKSGQRTCRHFFKEDRQMFNKHVKRYLASLIREVQIKATIRFHFTPFMIVVINKTRK